MKILLLFELITNDDILHGFAEERLAAADSYLSHHKPLLKGSLEVFEQMAEIAQIDAF